MFLLIVLKTKSTLTQSEYHVPPSLSFIGQFLNRQGRYSPKMEVHMVIFILQWVPAYIPEFRFTQSLQGHKFWAVCEHTTPTLREQVTKFMPHVISWPHRCGKYNLGSKCGKNENMCKGLNSNQKGKKMSLKKN